MPGSHCLSLGCCETKIQECLDPMIMHWKLVYFRKSDIRNLIQSDLHPSWPALWTMSHRDIDGTGSLFLFLFSLLGSFSLTATTAHQRLHYNYFCQWSTKQIEMWWALVRQLVRQDTMTMEQGGKQCQISLTAIVFPFMFFLRSRPLNCL